MLRICVLSLIAGTTAEGNDAEFTSWIQSHAGRTSIPKLQMDTTQSTVELKHSAVEVLVPGGADVSAEQAAGSRDYLLASFPAFKEVAYTQLPDNVWRILVLGDVTTPTEVAVDNSNQRLFVVDPPENKIYWYKLKVLESGLLETDGVQHVAVDSFNVSRMTVNSVGDLYFTGMYMKGRHPTYGIYKIDSADLETHNLHVQELHTRSSTGSVSPKLWMPSGIAVDAFHVYWGNLDHGTTYGSVCKGPLVNDGLHDETLLHTLSKVADEVAGMATTGTLVLYLTKAGVYAVPAHQASTTVDASEGLIAGTPVNDTAFDPVAITVFGGTAYFTEVSKGIVYSLPAANTELHNLTLYSYAPGIHGLAHMNLNSPVALHSSSMRSISVLPMVLVGALVFLLG